MSEFNQRGTRSVVTKRRTGIELYARGLASEAAELRARGDGARAARNAFEVGEIVRMTSRSVARRLSALYARELENVHRYAMTQGDRDQAALWLARLRSSRDTYQHPEFENALAGVLFLEHEHALTTRPWRASVAVREELAGLARGGSRRAKHLLAQALASEYAAARISGRTTRIRATWARALWWSRADEICYRALVGRVPSLRLSGNGG